MKNEDGFTIMELTSVLVIGSLIAGLSMTAYLFSEKSFCSWDKRNDVVRLVDGTVQVIVDDIREAKEITLFADTLVTLRKIDDREVFYHFGIGVPGRNDVALNGDTSITVEAGIASSSSEYTVDVDAVSKFLKKTVRVEVQRLGSSASKFRASLVDADSN